MQHVANILEMFLGTCMDSLEWPQKETENQDQVSLERISSQATSQQHTSEAKPEHISNSFLCSAEKRRRDNPPHPGSYSEVWAFTCVPNQQKKVRAPCHMTGQIASISFLSCQSCIDAQQDFLFSHQNPS